MFQENNISLESLVLNDSFRRWVLKNTVKDAVFWNGWIDKNADQIDLILQAREIILAMHVAQESIKEEEVEKEISRLTHTLNMSKEVSLIDRKNNDLFWQNPWLRVAAVIVLVVVSAVSYWYACKEVAPSVYSQEVKQAIDPLLEAVNQTSKSKLINLSDGSTVILSANSRLSYPRKFAHERREVFLQGEAFFEVTKNPEQPFLVHANGLISKVLGTSFTIRAFEQDSEVKVVVKTGKVSVYSQDSETQVHLKERKELTGLILTPNQQVIFNRKDHQMIRTLVAEPAVVNKNSIQQQYFNFNKMPIKEVFITLEQTYGVTIVYNEELVKGCELTGELGDEPLLEKMNLICKAIDGSYEMIDGQIIINNKSCK